MLFLERIVAGCVIPDKNTRNKNKLSQVGGSSWLLCSVWAAVGKSLQLESSPCSRCFQMGTDGEQWQRCPSVQKVPQKKSDIPRRWDLTPILTPSDLKKGPARLWETATVLAGYSVCSSWTLGPGDLLQICLRRETLFLLYASLSLRAEHG